ncbi:LPS-assembly protein LptD [Thioalkalivibrio sp. ALgr3]|uniref:LPS-assembly protein LptD n=1 Tax=Thioalkalivibrio sp. ALgr3 TaxID=1239292 RepID=UPI0003689C86|nr:LPS-assembly protein LptD [Thioalkalivibrio sp. ALgr3]
MRPARAAAVCLALVATAPAAGAETAFGGDRPAGCEFAPDAVWPALRKLPPDVREIEADHVRREGDQVRAEGDVQLYADRQRLDAEVLDYDRARGLARTEGAVRLFDGDLLLQGEDGRFQLDEDTGELSRIDYMVRSVPARGQAGAGTQLDPDRHRFERAQYTTCPVNRDSWRLDAARLDLDQESGRGVARHAVLRVRNVPVAYTPYIDFPLDDRRKSGFLLPSFGTGGRTGADLSLPWYWNIAPNYDATFTPRIMADRGIKLSTEFRYLQPAHEGQVDFRYLPDDRETGEDRQFVAWQHRTRITPGLRLDIDAADVSDSEYFRDFGSADRYSSSVRDLRRRADLTWSQPRYRLRTRVEDYQIVDTELADRREPYQRLPQITLEAGEYAGQWAGGGVTWDLDAELVRFARQERASDRPTGLRFDLDPELAWRFDTGGIFVEPRAGVRYTAYELDRRGEPGPESIRRTVPHAAVDSGLIFERDLADGERLQTLEPRLFYGYVPYRDQDDIPVFDTGEREFSFDNLFSLQRFTGADRVGDTHQLTAALTSRILDTTTGQERARLSVGEIRYFRDRRVRRSPSAPALEDRHSDLAVEGRLRIGDAWDGRGSVLYNREHKDTSLAALGVSWSPDERRRINLGYRQRADQLEQTDVSVLWPAGDRVDLVGRWNYSLRSERDLELLAGLQYRSCCYGLRVVARRSLDSDQRYDNSIHFQITLDGLARFDGGVDSLLSEGIAGYDAHPDR